MGRLSAIIFYMDKTGQYLEDLKSEDPAVRAKATRGLWILWHAQAGAEMEQELNEATRLMDRQQHEQALAMFQVLVEKCPEFSEAHNKLATLLFIMGQFEESVKECEEVLRRIPHHFGALNGMGLCLICNGTKRLSGVFKKPSKFNPTPKSILPILPVAAQA